MSNTRMFYCNTPNLGSVWASLHVGETFNRFSDFRFLGYELRKMHLAAGLPGHYNGEERGRNTHTHTHTHTRLTALFPGQPG